MTTDISFITPLTKYVINVERLVRATVQECSTELVLKAGRKKRYNISLCATGGDHTRRETVCPRPR